MTLLAVFFMAAATVVILAPDPASARLTAVLAQHRSPADDVVEAHTNPGTLATPQARLVASVLAGVAISVLATGPLAVMLGAVGGLGVWFMLTRLQLAGERAVDSPAATALVANLLVAVIRAGCGPTSAAAAIGSALGGPLGNALELCSAAVRVGATPERAWRTLYDHEAWRPLGRALAAATVRGTSPVPVLERVAADARDTARWEGEARARALGARSAIPLGLCFLPAFVLLAIVPIVVTSFG